MKRQHALLLYDSARTDDAAGSRSPSREDRTLIFRGDGLTVDLLVHVGRRPPAFLYGQMTQDEASLPVRGARLCFEGSDTVAKTDEHGEFSLSACDARGGGMLSIEVRGQALCCRIPPPVVQEDPT